MGNKLKIAVLFCHPELSRTGLFIKRNFFSYLISFVIDLIISMICFCCFLNLYQPFIVKSVNESQTGGIIVKNNPVLKRKTITPSIGKKNYKVTLKHFYI